MRHIGPLIDTFNTKKVSFKKKTPVPRDIRISFFPLAMISLFILLIGRLFQLTVARGAYYHDLATQNRVKEVTIEAPRGTIRDRKGFTLASSESPRLLESDLTPFINSGRFYADQYAFAHLVGYRQSASKEDIETDTCEHRITNQSRIGKTGIEKLFECDLRGVLGKKLVEVDSHGKFKRILTMRTPSEGKSITLSIDLELQKKAYELLISQEFGAYKKSASLIAIKPSTGEVLALVSIPVFSLDDFEHNSKDRISAYFDDPTLPLFNRSLQGTYPPGSTFKLVVASAALEEKKIDESFVIEDTGTIKAGTHTFGNWYFLQYGKTEGLVDIIKAIKRSNDIFFYKVGERLGEVEIKRYAQEFGFGKTSGIALDEAEGLIPSSFWKEEVIKDRWFLGDTYNMSIGQGYVLTTPIQVTRATAVFANGGNICVPQLQKIQNEIKPSCHRLPLSDKTLQIIKEGMKQACESGGTGWPFFEFKVKEMPISVACKTGTAESHAISKLPHAWFTAFAPFDAPEIVVTVLVEESGEGSTIAAPIAKELLKSYFERSE